MNNLITDVPGVYVSHAQDETALTGVSVLWGERPFTAAVDVRGGGPGTRETDLLEPHRLIQKIDSVVFSGGSAFGLGACSAVTDWLQEQKRGFQAAEARVPIVCGAVLFDLLNGGNKKSTNSAFYEKLGRKALETPFQKIFPLGNEGAGYGACAGSLKGGVGSASSMTEQGRVGAYVAVNSFGSVTMGETPLFWAFPYEKDKEFGAVPLKCFDPKKALHFSKKGFSDPKEEKGQEPQRRHTTLAVVATEAPLTQSQAKQVAIMAQDALARAIRPVHTPFDGDVVFALSTSGEAPSLSCEDILSLGNAAADCLTRAIARGVFEAETLGQMKSYQDKFNEISCVKIRK